MHSCKPIIDMLKDLGIEYSGIFTSENYLIDYIIIIEANSDRQLKYMTSKVYKVLKGKQCNNFSYECSKNWGLVYIDGIIINILMKNSEYKQDIEAFNESINTDISI